MNRIFLAACLGEEIIGSLLRYETCICAYYFFESKRFDPKRNPVFIEPVTSIINLKRMNDVCRYAPSLGSYTNQILGWKKSVHTFFESSDEDTPENKGNEVPSTTQLIFAKREVSLTLPEMQATAMDDIVVPECFPDSINKHVSLEKKNRAISGENVKELNCSQIKAINIALRASDSLVLLQGPPGTGKTYTISVLLKRLYRAGARVGICSSTNKAVRVAMLQFLRQFDETERSKLKMLLIGVDDSEIDEELEKFFVHSAPKKFQESYSRLHHCSRHHHWHRHSVPEAGEAPRRVRRKGQLSR